MKVGNIARSVGTVSFKTSCLTSDQAVSRPETNVDPRCSENACVVGLQKTERAPPGSFSLGIYLFQSSSERSVTSKIGRFGVKGLV